MGMWLATSNNGGELLAIRAVDALWASETSVVISSPIHGEDLEMRHSKVHGYYDTHREAKDFLIEIVKEKRDVVMSAVDSYNGTIDSIEAIEEGEDSSNER